MLLAVFVIAQQKINVNLEQRLITELFNIIEQQSDCRIYYQTGNIDSLYVTISITGEEPIKILEEALKNTKLKVSQFENNIIITDNIKILISLPEDFFKNKVTEKKVEYEISDLSLLQNIREQKATSENKIYEIGNPTAVVTGNRIRLSGVITDFKSGEPVPGITLSIKDPMIGAVTDGYGYYTINLPQGRHDLIIRGIGVKDTRRQIALFSEGKLDIELEENVYTLKEVVISADKIENVRGTMLGVEKLKLKEIKNIPMVFGEVDVIRAVMSLPGVKAVGEVSSGFNVRGGATDQNLILFNDATIYNPTHMFGFFSAFNPDLVKDMELYKSSIPPKYGGRISSVLDITTRDGNKKDFVGSASIGLLTSRLALEGPLFSEKTSYIIGGRTTYSNQILRMLPEESGYRDGKANFYDLNASLNHTFNEYNNLYLNGYYSSDHFSFNMNERYSYRNANASIKWRHIFSPKLTSVMTGGYDQYDYDTKNTEYQINAFKMSFGIYQYFGKADFNLYADDKHTINFGLNGIYYNLNPGRYVPNGKESLVVPDSLQKEKAFESAIYVGDNWNITQKLSINAGIRYSMFNVTGPRTYNEYQEEYIPSLATITNTKTVGSNIFKTYHGPELRVSARYEFIEDLSVKAGFNTMRQNIHKLSNTTIMSPTDTWKLSDANIKPQTGAQYSLGLYKNYLNNTLEISIEGYYKTMNDYLDYRSGAELLMNHNIETDVLSTSGRAYGVELMLKKAQGRLNGWISYTYSRTQLRQDDKRIVNPVNEGDWYPAD